MIKWSLWNFTDTIAAGLLFSKWQYLQRVFIDAIFTLIFFFFRKFLGTWIRPSKYMTFCRYNHYRGPGLRSRGRPYNIVAVIFRTSDTRQMPSLSPRPLCTNCIIIQQTIGVHNIIGTRIRTANTLQWCAAEHAFIRVFDVRGEADKKKKKLKKNVTNKKRRTPQSPSYR